MSKPIVIGASEVSALFDAHPYMTAFELWGIKAGIIPRKTFAGTEASFWGIQLEEGIARGYCAMNNRVLHVLEETFTRAPDSPHIVANLDYMHGEPGGKPDHILECKNVDFIKFRDDYTADSMPLNFELQVQQEMHCARVVKGTCAVLVAGNTLQTYDRDYRPAVMAKIKTAVEEFIDSIHAGRPPAADFSRDAEAISRKLRQTNGSTLDRRGDNYLTNLCVAYQEAAAQESAWKKKRTALKAEILEDIGHAQFVTLDRFTLTAATVREAPMNYTRGSYRNLNIKEM